MLPMFPLPTKQTKSDWEFWSNLRLGWMKSPNRLAISRLFHMAFHRFPRLPTPQRGEINGSYYVHELHYYIVNYTLIIANYQRKASYSYYFSSITLPSSNNRKLFSYFANNPFARRASMAFRLRSICSSVCGTIENFFRFLKASLISTRQLTATSVVAPALRSNWCLSTRIQVSQQ